MPAIKDITGQRFGRLVALRIVGKARRARWLCECDCGHEYTVEGTMLRSGNTRSCGCLQPQKARNRVWKHGHAQHGPSKTYTSWANMLRRCDDSTGRDFEYYGGRGISVCERWRSFENFLADMGERPIGLTLDRIENDRGYEPGNCRWATWSEQQINRRPKKLTANEVIAIRADPRTQQAIANDYRVSRELISCIKLRKVWRHI